MSHRDGPPLPRPEPPSVPAAWYPDTERPGGQRYWDGQAWTEHRIPSPRSSDAATPQPHDYVPNAGRQRRAWVIAAIVVAALLAGAWLTTHGGTDNPGSSTTDAAGGYRDGKFQFEVDRVECGKTHAAGETAQGQFCLVRMRVENIGQEPQTFDAGDQYAYDSTERKFAADTMASSESAFLQDINPGNAVQATIAFDIPKGDNLTSLELHDSPFSQGVKVGVD